MVKEYDSDKLVSLEAVVLVDSPIKLSPKGLLWHKGRAPHGRQVEIQLNDDWDIANVVSMHDQIVAEWAKSGAGKYIINVRPLTNESSIKSLIRVDVRANSSGKEERRFIGVEVEN